MSTEAAPTEDDFSAPLGQPQPEKRRRALPRAMSYGVAGALALALMGFATLVVTVDDPLGGEPSVLVAAKAPPKPAPTAAAATPGATVGNPAGSPTQQPAEGQGQTVTIIDGMSGKRQQVTLAPAAPSGAAPTLTPDSDFSEQSRHGPIPKISASGVRPSEAYAAKPIAGSPRNGVRVAIVVGRLGLSANTTTEAFAKLPPSVTLAFTPYGTDLGRWAARARSEGRELLLQAPMEPLDYPDNDPGPHTLLTSLAVEQNIDRLHWVMSRFGGYVGLSNHMGARFLANEPSVTSVMREASKRGLVYFDDGANARSIAPQFASAQGVPFAKADLVIDVAANAKEIDAALARLEAIARERGAAVGSASAIPVSIERIAQWAKSAERRGVILVPITDIVSRPKQS